jgi:hypothetical protein
MKDSLPPFLRGIGLSLVLTAAIIAFCIARQGDASRPATARQNPSSPADVSADSTLVAEVRELRADLEDDVVEEVLEDPWFEVIGLAGTAFMAASFFVEAAIRRKRRT